MQIEDRQSDQLRIIKIAKNYLRFTESSIVLGYGNPKKKLKNAVLENGIPY